jgi:hypothetical protein
VEFADGAHVELSADFGGCTFHIRDMSPKMANFVWEIASAGEMVILPAMKNFVPVLTSPAQKKHLPSDFSRDNPEPVVCESPGDFASFRAGGWRKYKDRVASILADCRSRRARSDDPCGHP